MKNWRLLVLVAVITGVAGLYYGKRSADEAPAIPVSEDGDIQNLKPAMIDTGATVENSAANDFPRILEELMSCLNIKGGAAESLIEKPTIDHILNLVQADLGLTTTVDRWMNWHLRTYDGNEKRVRIEINENEEGKLTKEMSVFLLDEEGLPVPIPDMDEQKVTDSLIAEHLKEGEVFFKEKAAAAIFPAGERIEFVEKNGVLSEFEFLKANSFYRCPSLKSKAQCQCVK